MQTINENNNFVSYSTDEMHVIQNQPLAQQKPAIAQLSGKKEKNVL